MAMSTGFEIQTDANNKPALGVVVPGVGVVGGRGGQVVLDSARNQMAGQVVVRAPIILLGPTITNNLLPASITTAGNTNPIDASDFEMLAVDLSVTAVSGTTPSLTVFLERQLSDGATWSPIWSPTAITATGLTSTSVGPGLATNAIWGQFIRLRWTISGTTPSFTVVASIYGK